MRPSPDCSLAILVFNTKYETENSRPIPLIESVKFWERIISHGCVAASGEYKYVSHSCATGCRAQATKQLICPADWVFCYIGTLAL